MLHADAPYLFDGLTVAALPLVIARRRLRRWAPWCCWPASQRGARACSPWSRWPAIVVAWGVAQWPYMLPETLTVAEAAAPTGTLQRCSSSRSCSRS